MNQDKKALTSVAPATYEEISLSLESLGEDATAESVERLLAAVQNFRLASGERGLVVRNAVAVALAAIDSTPSESASIALKQEFMNSFEARGVDGALSPDLEGKRLSNPLEWSEALKAFDERDARLQQSLPESDAKYRYNVAGHEVDSVDEALEAVRSVIYVSPARVPEYAAALRAGQAVTVTYGFSSLSIDPFEVRPQQLSVDEKTTYTFDLKLATTLSVTATSREEGERLLREALQFAQTNFGAISDEPLLGEVFVEGEMVLSSQEPAERSNGDSDDLDPSF